MQLDDVILSTLIHNDDYAQKVMPFLRADYFYRREHRLVFELVHSYITKYGKPPSIKALTIDLGNTSNVPQELYDNTLKLLDGFQATERDMDWLVDNTEKFCKQNAITNIS